MLNNLFECLVADGDQALFCGCIDRLTADERRMTQIRRFLKIIRGYPCDPWSNLGKTGEFLTTDFTDGHGSDGLGDNRTTDH